MKRGFLVLIGAAVALAAAGAYAGIGSVISSFPITGNIMAHGVAWNGQYLAVTNYHGSGDRMWRHYTTTGSLVGSFDPPRGPYSPVQFGAEFDGTYYWGADLFQQQYVYRFTTEGSTISSFPVPYPSGIAWDGSNLWIISLYSNGTVRRYTTAGSIMGSFSVASLAYGWDMAWDGTYLWCANRPSSGANYVFRFTTQGSVLASFAAPGTFTSGCGCDGRYLWLSDNSGTKRVYQVDAGLTQNVAPASAGKIKALFR